MKIRMICFTGQGQETGKRILQYLEQAGWDARLENKSWFLPQSVPETTARWSEKYWESVDALLFIGSCGIAVRSIAMLVKSKLTDPAVLVVDERGTFVISLLSGHFGGANELTDEIASAIGAVSVVTTATDRSRVFAADVFARKNGCRIPEPSRIRMISGALLAGRKVGFVCDFPWEGTLPEGLTTDFAEEDGIAVTVRRDFLPFRNTLVIVPPVILMGIGCKKGKTAVEILRTAEQILEEAGIRKEAVRALATIDLKKEEPGICSLAEAWGIPLRTYTAEELRSAEGAFSSSEFVQQVTGVDNVCERSAFLASDGGEFLLRKQCREGITVALCQASWRCCFE